MSEPVRLNIGAGTCTMEGFVPVDLKLGQDARRLDEYADESVDEVYASHVLEHFGHREIATVLAEWVRVLKPCGRMRLAVPDFRQIAGRYHAGRSRPEDLACLFGGQTDANDYHCVAFDEATLEGEMRRAGLVGIRAWSARPEQGCAALDVSLNLEGWKPDGDLRGEVLAVMSMPRLSWTDNAFCATNQLGRLGVRLANETGAYFEQCLTRLLEKAVAEGYRFALCVDYDTIYRAEDVRDLYWWARTDASIGAVAAVQTRRESDQWLMRLPGPEGFRRRELQSGELDGQLLEVDATHFGLTLIQCETLTKMARPWLQARPDPGGGWGDGKVDADIGFWARLRAAKYRACVATRVVVGHLETVIAWPGRERPAVWQRVTEYRTDGRPRGALHG